MIDSTKTTQENQQLDDISIKKMIDLLTKIEENTRK